MTIITTPNSGIRVSSKSHRLTIAVAFCFLLSGFAALLYQTAWMRQFSVVFGTSELAVAAVLSAYMAGLALGAAIAGRFVGRVTKPVLIYGLLEAGIAVSALAVPLFLKLANSLYISFFGGQAVLPDASGVGQSLFYFVITLLVLVIPTACMGATLPLLTRYVVRREDQIGTRVGMLYAVNTAGAVAGTLVAAFLLLPEFGLSGTVWIGIAINFLVFLIAAGIAKMAGNGKTATAIETRPARLRFSIPGRFWILPIMLLSGATTFTYEVLWTRLLSHVLGGSVIAFATMLASFLTGIALGSAFASRIAKSSSQAFHAFVTVQVLIALTSAGIYQSLPLLVPDAAGFSDNVLLAIMIMLPATLFIGATFPLAVRILALNEQDAANASARVYAWNTAGAIIGAAVAGFVLIPVLRFEGSISLAVGMNLLLALAAVTTLDARQIKLVGATGIPLLAALVFYRPGWPEEILRVSPFNEQRQGRVHYYGVGRSSTVLALERDGFLYIRNNGLPEAAADMAGAPPAKSSQRLLTTLPVLARPDAKEMLIIGYGGGVAAEHLSTSLRAIDILELEPKVIDANRAISADRNVEPLDDPRVNIVINDARSALQLTDKRYDIIVSQPSHPWTAAASHLYTKEFMELVISRLEPGGVFLQWMNSVFVTEELLRSFSATLLEVFPNVRLYQWEPRVLYFLASDQPLELERQIAKTGRPLCDHPEHYLGKGIGSLEDVVAALLLDQAGIENFAEGSELITDDFNRLATDSARAQEEGRTLNYSELLELMVPHMPLLRPDSWIHKKLGEQLNFAYIGDRYTRSRAAAISRKLSTLLESAGHSHGRVIDALLAKSVGNRSRAIQALMASLQLDESDEQARFSLLLEFSGALAEGSATKFVQSEYAKASPPVRAVTSLWHRAQSGDSAGSKDAEDQLKDTDPEDLWYLAATKLRVDWRNKLDDATLRKEKASESMQLIDNAISLYQDLDFYGMRVAAAFLAERPLDVIETARRMLWVIDRDIDLLQNETGSNPAHIARKELVRTASIGQVLNMLAEQGSVPEYRLQQLRNELQRVTEKLESFN